jgi:hypothetical protein
MFSTHEAFRRTLHGRCAVCGHAQMCRDVRSCADCGPGLVYCALGCYAIHRKRPRRTADGGIDQWFREEDQQDQQQGYWCDQRGGWCDRDDGLCGHKGPCGPHRARALAAVHDLLSGRCRTARALAALVDGLVDGPVVDGPVVDGLARGYMPAKPAWRFRRGGSFDDPRRCWLVWDVSRPPCEAYLVPHHVNCARAWRAWKEPSDRGKSPTLEERFPARLPLTAAHSSATLQDVLDDARVRVRLEYFGGAVELVASPAGLRLARLMYAVHGLLHAPVPPRLLDGRWPYSSDWREGLPLDRLLQLDDAHRLYSTYWVASSPADGFSSIKLRLENAHPAAPPSRRAKAPPPPSSGEKALRRDRYKARSNAAEPRTNAAEPRTNAAEPKPAAKPDTTKPAANNDPKFDATKPVRCAWPPIQFTQCRAA